MDKNGSRPTASSYFIASAYILRQSVYAFSRDCRITPNTTNVTTRHN